MGRDHKPCDLESHTFITLLKFSRHKSHGQALSDIICYHSPTPVSTGTINITQIMQHQTRP